MSKEILTGLIFLCVGVGIGVFMFKDDLPSSSASQSQEKKSGTGSELENVSEAGATRENPTLSSKKVVISTAEMRFDEIKNEEIKRAVQSSFQHPLDGGEDKNAYEDAIQKLNNDPEEALKEISKSLAKMNPNSDGVRIHLINLAMQTNADTNTKGEFIRDYLTKAKFKVIEGKLTDDSYSAVIAIDYLGQNFKGEAEVAPLVQEILSVKNEELRNQLQQRLKVYFPNLI